MMSGNCTSKKELLQFIDQVSFAIDDLLLFLDTHPKEKRALEYYSELSARRNELLEKYAKFYGPLTIDTGNDSKSITANTDTTNHAICVNVMGNGSLKSLME